MGDAYWLDKAPDAGEAQMDRKAERESERWDEQNAHSVKGD